MTASIDFLVSFITSPGKQEVSSKMGLMEIAVKYASLILVEKTKA